ncbi:MAG: alcohol dehydrogenase catalytic domain-containing protein [Spirochaetes bacterium]|nr:alcohol dehydrogenase catalytic domain-containing protein [Spirochaetota bacterium]
MSDNNLKMRSLLFRKTGEMVLRKITVPSVGVNEVLIRVKYCGICGTDVHAFRNGLLIPENTVMGHEITGVIETAGRNVRKYKKGERVIINPLARCGECYWCRRKEYSLCETAASQEIGFHPGYDGGLADFILVRHPDSMIMKIPDSVPMEAAALIEPLATSLHAVKKSRFKKNGTAVVIGAGMIGLGVISFLKMMKAGRIITVEPCRVKAELALRSGADAVIDPSLGRKETLEDVLKEMESPGAPVVFECAGVASAFRDAPEYAVKGGQVILAGFCEQEVGVRPIDWILREIEVKAILGYYDEFSEVMKYLGNGKIRTENFITDIISLEMAEKNGFHRIAKDNSIVKILVDMELQD